MSSTEETSDPIRRSRNPRSSGQGGSKIFRNSAGLSPLQSNDSYLSGLVDDQAAEDGSKQALEAVLDSTRRSGLKYMATGAQLSTYMLLVCVYFLFTLSREYLDKSEAGLMGASASSLVTAAIVAFGLSACAVRFLFGYRVRRMKSLSASYSCEADEFFRLIDVSAYLVSVMWAIGTLFVYPHVRDRNDAVSYIAIVVGSVTVSAFFMLPFARRGYYTLICTQSICLLIAHTAIDATRSYTLALLGVAMFFMLLSQSGMILRRTAQNVNIEHRYALLQAQLIEKERKQLMQAAAAAAEAEHESSERLHVFLARISHEIRSPAHMLLTESDILQQIVRDLDSGALRDLEPLRELSYRLDNASSMLEHQMKELSGFVKEKSWRLSDENADPVQVGVPQIINSVCTHHRLKATAKGLAFDVDAQDMSVLMRADKVRQILDNLIGNAVKYTNQGRIVVRGRVVELASGPALRLEVEDTGIGIPDSVRNKIFEPFVRADSARKTAGMGMGLAIVKAIAEKLGATVEFESRPGQTVFVVQLPVQIANAVRPS